MLQTTLCLLIKDDHVLLAMKKRGFGVSKWNGYGGKVLPGETLEAAVVREIEEESTMKVRPEDLEKVAHFKFYFKKSKQDWNQEMHVFVCRKWEGLPAETGEMHPQWFHVKEIPFEHMWPDDHMWYPQILAGKKLEGEFFFNENADGFDKVDIREI